MKDENKEQTSFNPTKYFEEIYSLEEKLTRIKINTKEVLFLIKEEGELQTLKKKHHKLNLKIIAHLLGNAIYEKYSHQKWFKEKETSKILQKEYQNIVKRLCDTRKSCVELTGDNDIDKAISEVSALDYRLYSSTKRKYGPFSHHRKDKGNITKPFDWYLDEVTRLLAYYFKIITGQPQEDVIETLLIKCNLYRQSDKNDKILFLPDRVKDRLKRLKFYKPTS